MKRPTTQEAASKQKAAPRRKPTKTQTTTEGFYYYTGYSGFDALRDGRYSADVDMGCKYINGNTVVDMKKAAYVYAMFQGTDREPRTYTKINVHLSTPGKKHGLKSRKEIQDMWNWLMENRENALAVAAAAYNASEVLSKSSTMVRIDDWVSKTGETMKQYAIVPKLQLSVLDTRP